MADEPSGEVEPEGMWLAQASVKERRRFLPQIPDRGRANGQLDRTIADYDALAATLAEVPGVTHSAPLIRGQVMANFGSANSGVEIFGIRGADLASLRRLRMKSLTIFLKS